jgi:hypothetical protein
MKKIRWGLALAGMFVSSHVQAISLDDIQIWTGSGTNRAALVIEWNSPLIFNQTSVAAPVANKTLVWGYRFNGPAAGTQMFNAIVAADPRLYAVEHIDPMFGTGVDAIGFNLDGSGIAGITDGTVTDHSNAFTNGVLMDASLNVDGAQSLNQGDLFWSGHYGPYWQLWNELGDNGGFPSSPNRGTNEYWNGDTYAQGQWSSAYYGLDYLPLTNGSWIGFSVSADGYPTNNADPNYETELSVFNNDEQAPPSPDGNYVAYVCNTNDFAVQIINTTNIEAVSPYNNPAAVLGLPTLQFLDPYAGGVTNRVSIIDDPYNVAPDGSDVLTEITAGGEITVMLGRKVYDEPNNPYGIDLIVYGNSFFWSLSGISGFVSDGTDLNAATFKSSAIAGHSATVSVSQDGVNWYTYTNTPVLFPDEAYRWDDTNDSWTAEEMNPTKPINPYLYTNNFAGETVAGALDQFVGAAGGTGYSLHASGFPWIQYVRIQPAPGTYTVIDAIAAVNPAVVGDALSIAPDNIAAGITNLAFQEPDNADENLISVNFGFVSGVARVSTVSLHEFSAFGPVAGNVSSAYQITLKSAANDSAVAFQADVGLRAGDSYTGNGSDLRVYQWCGTNWVSQPFTFNAANGEAVVAGATNSAAYVISQIVPPRLSIQTATNGVAFQFAPVPNCVETLERSTNLVTWTPVCSLTARDAPSETLQDTNAPAGPAFYRLELNVP